MKISSVFNFCPTFLIIITNAYVKIIVHSTNEKIKKSIVSDFKRSTFVSMKLYVNNLLNNLPKMKFNAIKSTPKTNIDIANALT